MTRLAALALLCLTAIGLGIAAQTTTAALDRQITEGWTEK